MLTNRPSTIGGKAGIALHTRTSKLIQQKRIHSAHRYYGKSRRVSHASPSGGTLAASSENVEDEKQNKKHTSLGVSTRIRGTVGDFWTGQPRAHFGHSRRVDTPTKEEEWTKMADSNERKKNRAKTAGGSRTVRIDAFDLANVNIDSKQ